MLQMRRPFFVLAPVILFVVFHPRAAVAGLTSPVNIVGVDVRNDGLFLIDVSQATTGAPACASVTNRLSANSNTAGGKALLQLAISVYLSGKVVVVEGTGACSDYSNIESIARIYSR
jgi:hypothetical protein